MLTGTGGHSGAAGNAQSMEGEEMFALLFAVLPAQSIIVQEHVRKCTDSPHYCKTLSR